MEVSVIFTPRPLCPLNMRLGALHSCSGRFGEENNLPLPVVGPTAIPRLFIPAPSLNILRLIG